jgi:hypothetical protein
MRFIFAETVEKFETLPWQLPVRRAAAIDPMKALKVG